MYKVAESVNLIMEKSSKVYHISCIHMPWHDKCQIGIHEGETVFK